MVNFNECLKTTYNLLEQNNEWNARYAEYAEKIMKHIEGGIKPMRFQVNPPFSRYTCISNATDHLLQYDLRVAGQSVATVFANPGAEVIISTKGKDDANKKYFSVTEALPDGTLWNSKKASTFRSQFSQANTTKTKSPEHRLENCLLKEFKKTSADGKSLCNIQPVKLNGAFFQMPTPFKASTGTPEYANNSGGGIDILSRVKHKDCSTHLCVMELKDENKATEPPQKVAAQVLAYAVFIACLLRSKSGDVWYKIFGFSGSIPQRLVIDVAVVMPYDKSRSDNFKDIPELKVCNNTYLKLYSLYFKEKGGSYEFIGSLKDDMLPHTGANS